MVDNGTVLSVSSRALLQACQSIGLDTEALLQRVGVERSTIDDPDGRIEVGRATQIWALAYEISGDPNLALHAVEALPFGAYKVIDFLAWNAPTIGGAVEKVCEYFPIINTTARLSVDVAEREVHVRLQSLLGDDAITRPYAEYVLAAVFLRCREAVGVKWPLRKVQLRHTAPADVSEHERVFECPVLFGADATGFSVERVIWDMPTQRADHNLFEVLEQHARMLIEQLPTGSGLLGRVREAISHELRGGNPSLQVVAKALAVSTRTLQRRLDEQDLSFAQVLDEMREATSKSYLEDRTVAISEVAFLLGFAEQSSFNRAFKRWTGSTPSVFRKSL